MFLCHLEESYLSHENATLVMVEEPDTEKYHMAASYHSL